MVQLSDSQTVREVADSRLCKALGEDDDATGVPIRETLGYADGFMKDFEPGTSEHDELLGAMASSEWDVDLETARTIDSRLREVYDADIDADDVHTTGNAMVPQPQYAAA
ncbi:MAG: hypothetical protein JWO34_2663 [Arthrobacter sp.]|nr:hypothetical protein [Arthrobacter sp.]